MLIGYHKDFAPAVMAGTKCITFRRWPKRMPKVGERAYEYTGLRTKHCRHLREDRVIRGLYEAEIALGSLTLYDHLHEGKWWEFLFYEELSRIAIADGFADYEKLYAWHDKAENTQDFGNKMLAIDLGDWHRADLGPFNHRFTTNI